MRKLLALLIIFGVALVLRLYNLGNHPPGLTWDEAGLGYNAYSILKTGRDEFGVRLPLIFKSFGDYKPGVYIYLTVPSVAVFGLTEFAVRLPSALFGALAVIGIYFLVNEIFASKKLGLIAAVVLTFMPWHLHFSRGGWEVNTFVTMMIFGSYFLLHSLNKPKFSPLWSLVVFTLAIFTYQAAKLLVPLAALAILVLYADKTRTKIKEVAKNEKKLFI